MRASGNVRPLTGCPFSDAWLSGLELDPRLDCGPAFLRGAQLVWDPSFPVYVQLREIAELTRKWRARRGLHIVRASTAARTEGPTNDEPEATDVYAIGSCVDLANTSGASRSQRLRNNTDPTDPAHWVQNDAPGVQLRHARKLPLGV
jgi:hypothetical protein